MVWGRRALKDMLPADFSFPIDRSLKIAENSYHIAYMTNSKANSFCGHTKLETMNCSCGEDEKDFAWVWSTKEDGGQAGSIVLGPEHRQISFNPEYSSGTAAVRGSKILPNGYHHYWELKMTSAVYGTNIMLGVCTPNCDMKHGIHRFCSLLGRDDESWGYSYTGTTQHAGKFSRYGPRWGKGAIVGVHLDTWRGTVEFFLNREPLGIAFTGLQNKELYPIVTSTSAHSGMKLVTSYMIPHSLQFLSSEVLFKRLSHKRDIHPDDLALPPGLHTHIMKNYWPFIKYVSLRSGSNRLEYIRVRSSKRSHEEDSTDAKRPKRVCAHHLFKTTEPYIGVSEIRSSPSPPESSSNGGSSSLSDHRCLHVPSTCDKSPFARKRCHCCECFRVLFDSKSSHLVSQSVSTRLSSGSSAGDDQSKNISTSKADDSSGSQSTESSTSKD